LVIEVYSGLTSRIKTLNEAYDIAKRNRESLTIIWPKEYHCYIDFWEVFDTASFPGVEIRLIQINFGKYKDESIRALLKSKQLIRCCKAIKSRIIKTFLLVQPTRIGLTKLKAKCVFFDTTPPSHVGWPKGATTGWDNYLEWDRSIRARINSALAGSEDEIYIRAYCGFSITPKLDYSALIFKKTYVDNVNGILGNHESVVGIHMRRNDHDLCISINPTNEFYLVMDKMIQSSPNIAFFLATDSKQTEYDVIQKYGSRILFQKDKSWGFGSVEGMKSSIIDLLALSKCQTIVGSEGSIFSEFAAEYGGTKLIYCHESLLWESFRI